MTTTVHKNLTGADLHESKGVSTALAGQVYVTDGAGSGAWTTASSVITNTAFTTGDTKTTIKTVADSGWIMWSTGGSIGDGSSGATNRANADTAALYSLMWNNFADVTCPVSGGRGVSAVADFAAHKTLSLLTVAGRVIGSAGSGPGLTVRGLGTTTGFESNFLSTSNLPPYTPAGTIGLSAVSHNAITGGASGASAQNAVNGSVALWTFAVATINSPTATFTGAAQGGTQQAFTITQPTVFLNIMMKL